MSEAKPRERRKRDPEGTRTVILDAAQSILAQDGAEALSVSRVANLAGVNRGTAYQHFLAKEDLIQATMDRVSHQLLEAVFEESDEDVGAVVLIGAGRARPEWPQTSRNGVPGARRGHPGGRRENGLAERLMGGAAFVCVFHA